MVCKNFVPEFSQQKLFLEQTVSGSVTKVAYIKKSVCIEDVTLDNSWTFELGVDKELHVFFLYCSWINMERIVSSTNTKF